MSAERALLRRVKVLLECSNMEPLQRQTDLIIGEIKELLAQPEEGVYQRLLRIEDGIEVEILPSELWMDGYETGRKDPPKREPLSEEAVGELLMDGFSTHLMDLVRMIEKAQGIGVNQ